MVFGIGAPFTNPRRCTQPTARIHSQLNTLQTVLWVPKLSHPREWPSSRQNYNYAISSILVLEQQGKETCIFSVSRLQTNFVDRQKITSYCYLQGIFAPLLMACSVPWFSLNLYCKNFKVRQKIC